jgi:hypothetical protein
MMFMMMMMMMIAVGLHNHSFLTPRNQGSLHSEMCP